MTFRLDHHNKILTILESLDSDVLKEGSAYFGGATLLALDFQEYRWSKDVDFIIPCGKTPSVTQWNLGMKARAGS